MKDYQEAKRNRDIIERRLSEASQRLRSIPGVGSGPMGLTPDKVKLSQPYRHARTEYDRLNKALRYINQHIARNFRKEANADRAVQRKLRQAKRVG